MQKIRFWGNRTWNGFCIAFTLAMCVIGIVKACGLL
jgi:hypothetical protein